MRAAHIDERAFGRTAHLEHVGLDVLADAVVLAGRLVGGGQDRLRPAHVQDHAARFHTAHGAGDDLGLALRVLAEHLLALDLAQPLAYQLGGQLRMDAAEAGAVQLADLDQLTHLRVGLVRLGVVHGELDGRILDFVDHVHRAVCAEASAVRVDIDEHVLVAGSCPPVGRLDGLGKGGHQLLARDVLFGIQLQERADEVTVHVAPSFRSASRCPPLGQTLPLLTKKRGGHPRSEAAKICRREYTPEHRSDRFRPAGQARLTDRCRRAAPGPPATRYRCRRWTHSTS